MTNSVTNPHFTQTLHYETTGGVPGASPRWNGNVSADVWTAPDRVGEDASLFTHRYAYGYDGLDRLTDAAYSQPLWEWDGGNVMNQSQPDYSVHCAYDLNGNITSLRRGGVTTSVNVGTTRVLDYGTVDNLTLSYDGNRLRRVGDSEDDLTYAGAMEFVNGTDQSVEYTWDANGNMTSDLNRGITAIRYNVLNLPERVTWADGHRTEHTYAADGRKLRTCHKVVDTGIATPVAGPAAAGPAAEPRGGAIGGGLIGPGIDPPVVEIPYVTVLTRDYSGSHIWRNDTLERVLTDVGFVGEDGRHRCFVNDCRGNVRAVVRRNADGTGTLEQVNSYYPGGMPMLTEVVYGDGQPYKYTGKELERQHGLNQYDFGARWYDPAHPGTTTMDPLGEQRPWESPYLWCAGNPVRNVDPDGKFPWAVLIGPTVDYGFQVYNNYQEGMKGYDAWLGKVNFISVGISAISVGGVAKTAVVEGFRAAVTYKPNDGLKLETDASKIATQAGSKTVLSITVLGAKTSATNFVQKAEKNVVKAEKNVKSAVNKVNRKPNSTKAKANLEKASVEAIQARNEQVAANMLNYVAAHTNENVFNESVTRIYDLITKKKPHDP